MQVSKLLPAFVLTGVACAGPLERRKERRSDCIMKEAKHSAERAPAGKFDVAICYHGKNSAYENMTDITSKNPDVFGDLRWADCNGIGLDCFWMRGENAFAFYGDGGSDNIAIVFMNDRCAYDRDCKTVSCESH